MGAPRAPDRDRRCREPRRPPGRLPGRDSGEMGPGRAPCRSRTSCYSGRDRRRGAHGPGPFARGHVLAGGLLLNAAGSQTGFRGAGSCQDAASLLLLVGLWQIGAVLAQSRLFPPPTAVLQSLVAEIRDGALLTHLGVTLARVAASFVVAMALGTALGLA